MSIDVEIYEKIRQLKEEGIYGKKTIAKKLGVSKNTVKKYWDGSHVPWVRKEGSGLTKTIVTPEILEFINNCLTEDKDAPKKQHHTARRIYERLVREKSFSGAESTIRNVVANLKKNNPQAFVPLEFMPGEAIQVDWGEATIWLKDQKIKVNLWCMRECYSCAIYVEAFYRQNEKSFLEGMRNGFEYFSGSPKKVIFDNAKVAVSEGFGKTAKTTEQYRKLSAHYVFTPTFCNVAEGHEKGLVENLVGLCRRNALVPVPHVDNMEELNTMLMKYCNDYHTHKINSKSADVGTMLNETKNALHCLPPYRYDTARILSVKANNFSTIKFDYNKYSVPFQYAGKDMTVKAYGRKIEIMFSHKVIAEYERDYHRNRTHYQLEHYMTLIERRPRSVYNAAPVRASIPDALYEVLLRMESPENVIRVLNTYMRNPEAVLHAVDNHFSSEQILTYLEEKEEFPDAKTKITVSVNSPELSQYDNLIRRC